MNDHHADYDTGQSTDATNPRPKKEDRRVRRTKKLLTQALTQLLEEKQIKDITVRELTDLADMNRGTFYLYYRDIFDMLERIEGELFDSLEQIFAKHAPEEILHLSGTLMTELFTFIADNQDICRVLLSPHGDMQFLHSLNHVIRNHCLDLWKTAEPGLPESLFEYAYSFVVFGVAGVIRNWLNRGCPESADEMARNVDAMVHGIHMDLKLS